MKVCIIGDGLTSLTLAKALVNQGIIVDLFCKQKTNKLNENRTLSISKSNFDFFNENISNIKKLSWKINRIEIFSENLNNERLINFENKNKHLFYIIKNNQIYNLLKSKLIKIKNFKFKKIYNYQELLKKNYNLIINCEMNNFFTKKFFYKKIDKDYKSFAYATIIEHKKIKKNDTAVQIFTQMGPLAFLPLSEKKTSIVYSIRGKKEINLESLIKNYNKNYSITKIQRPSIFSLKSTNLRVYHYKNILAFGDLLHKIHPLAGQGFNMTIRDIRELLEIIKNKINNGLQLDSSICSNFEKNTKHKNYLFLNGIDFIYEYFNLESKFDNDFMSKSVKFLGKNKFLNDKFIKYANEGLFF